MDSDLDLNAVDSDLKAVDSDLDSDLDLAIGGLVTSLLLSGRTMLHLNTFLLLTQIAVTIPDLQVGPNCNSVFPIPFLSPLTSLAS